MRTVLRTFSLLLLGLWLGAAIFFSAAVAPGVFAVLREAGLANASSLAGSIVARLLATVNRGGFEVAVFVLVMSYFLTQGQTRLRKAVQMISLAIMAIMTGVAHWVVGARLATLRALMQVPVEQIALTDPRRIEFDRLHRYSVAMLAVAMIAGLIAFLLVASRTSKPRDVV